MDEYVKYLESVYAELFKMPPDHLNKKMDEISSPELRMFIEAPINFESIDDSDIDQYCESTIKSNKIVMDILEKEDK